MTETAIAPLRTLQFIVLALLVGAGAWVAWVAYSVWNDEGPPDPVGLGNTFLGIWAALAVAGGVAWPFVRNRCQRRAAAEIAEAGGREGQHWALQQYWVATVSGAATAQGVTLFAAAGAFATHHAGLLIATLPGLVVVALLFPTERRFARFLQRGGVDVTDDYEDRRFEGQSDSAPKSETDRVLLRQTRVFGTSSVSFGTLFVVMGVGILAIVSFPVFEVVSERNWYELGTIFLVGLPVLIVAGGGVSLVVGGRRFRRREDSGRRILIGTIATYFVLFSVVLGLQFAGTAVLEDTPWWGRLMGIGHLLLVFGAVLFLLWRGIVFLRSPQVVELCSSTKTGSRDEDQKP